MEYQSSIQVGEYLASEAPGARSRTVAVVSVTDARRMQSGTVLGRVTATGKLVRHNRNASDGSQTAIAVLFSPLPGGAADHKAVVHDTDCEVLGGALNDGEGADLDAQSQLAVRGIKTRGAPAVTPATLVTLDGKGLTFNGMAVGWKP